jgi:hypothetical protein
MAQSRLRSLGEGDTSEFFPQGEAPPPPGNYHPQFPPPPETRLDNAATNVLMLALRALGHRAVIAVANLFVLITAVSAWWLWLTTLPSPSVLQLVGLGLYGLLILALNWLVLRRT